MALFVTVHNDSIFVKCSNIFDQLFDRILEWVSNWFIPLEMEFSKFELVFENLVQVSFSSKLKLNYSIDFVLSHFTDKGVKLFDDAKSVDQSFVKIQNFQKPLVSSWSAWKSGEISMITWSP